jgi:hypothetical protein
MRWASLAGDPSTRAPEKPATAASPVDNIGGRVCAFAAADRNKKNNAKNWRRISVRPQAAP